MRRNFSLIKSQLNSISIVSLALLAIPLTKRPWLTGTLMTTGVILFTGTCYYAAFTGDQRFNRLAPIGGTTLILAWISMALF